MALSTEIEVVEIKDETSDSEEKSCENDASKAVINESSMNITQEEHDEEMSSVIEDSDVPVSIGNVKVEDESSISAYEDDITIEENCIDQQIEIKNLSTTHKSDGEQQTQPEKPTHEVVRGRGEAAQYSVHSREPIAKRIEMEPKIRPIRACPEHFAAMVEFMERHGDLSKPHAGVLGRVRSEALWQKLANLLNSQPGSVKKSAEKWKKVWADWKAKTKKKYLINKQHGGVIGPDNRRSLTALEERVAAIIVGQGGARKRGSNKTVATEATPKQINGIVVEFMEQVPLSDKIVFVAPIQTPQPPIEASVPSLGIPAPPPRLPSPQPLPLQPQPSSPEPTSPRTPPPEDISHQASASSHPTVAPLPTRQLKTCRKRHPFVRTASNITIERLRLQHEITREKLLHERETERERLLHERETERERLYHERETERLRLESERIQVSREHNREIHQLGVIYQGLIDVMRGLQRQT